jgi:signal transduction histidine kinase/CheY-like chemotaxis protein/PAS domain-containing protein
MEALRAPAVSAEYLVGRVTGLRSLTFASRLEPADAAAPGGVIFASLDLDRAAARLRELKLPDYMRVDITTADGIVLASTHADPGVLGRPLGDLDLGQRIKSAASRPGDVPTAGQAPAVRLIGDFRPTSILVAARVDADRLLAPALRHLQMGLAALLLAAGLGAALAWRLGHRGIAGPVAGLLLRMRRFGAGEPDNGPPARPLAVELTALHDAFAQMRETLQERARERERLLSELKDLQAKIVASQRISRIGYWEVDLRTGRLGGTSHLAGILGTAIPQTIQEWLTLLPQADGERLQQALEAAWMGKGPVDIEYPMPLATASAGWVRMQGELRTAEDGTPEKLQGSVQDITERKVAEVRLAAQMGRLQLLHRITRAIADRLSISEILRIVVAQLEEQMPLALCAAAPFDAHSNAIHIEHLGVRSQPNAARMQLKDGDTIAADGDGLSRAVRGELVYEPDTGVLTQELPMRLAGIGLHSLVLVPLRTRSGDVFGVILAARAPSESFSSTDCEFLRQLGEQAALALHQAELYTALRQAYETLQRSQAAALRQERLRALGEMASGIAHDINNAVSPLTLYIESLLKHEAGLSAAGRQKLETMQLAAQGIAHTVERMREFHPAHDSPSDRRQSAVNSAVRHVIELTGARWRDTALRGGAKIDVVADLDPEVPDVQINDGDLRDALINLVFNAVDAMPSGGTLTLRTRCATGDPSAPMVEVCVADTGVGMNEETRRQCLEPFYTTKGVRGTGLGLAMVFATVQRHHGHLAIDTAPGEGTTVRIQLPAHSSRAAAVPVPAADAPRSAPLKLLLADDDHFVLFPLRDALRDDGHDVSTAEGGREAIELVRGELQSGCPFDAVITDLGMPGVDGSQVAREVKTLCPSILVVLLTGWGRRMADNGHLPPFVDTLLSKPPRLDELRAALRSARPAVQD